MRPMLVSLLTATFGLSCTKLNPAFIDDAGGSGSETLGGDGTASASTTNTGDGDTGDGDGTTGDGDGTTGDGTTGDGTTGDGDGDGDGTTGDGTFPFECGGDVSLIGCWPFDGDGVDGSVHGHNLTISSETYTSGMSNQAIAFADLTLANVNTTVTLSPNSTMSIEFWMNPYDAPVYTLVSKSGSYEVSVENGSLVCAFGPGDVIVFPISWTAGTWHHVVCMHNGSLIRLFVDGIESAVIAAQTSIGSSSAALHIGSLSPSWSNWYEGKLDNLRLWSRELTPLEICDASGTPCP